MSQTKRPSISGSRILVTGGAGFIGSHLVDSLLKLNAKEVVVIDNLFCGTLENLSHLPKEKVTVYKDDAEDFHLLGHVIKSHKINIVFDCATKALNYSFANPLSAFSVNTTITGNLLELQRLGAFQTLCHFSSSEVFGTALVEPMTETHPLFPETTYAAGKAGADLFLRSYVKMFSNDAFIVRPFNNFGPRQNFEGPLAGVIPLTIARIFSGGTPEIHGTGKQSRDFIYVKDTVECVLKCYDIAETGEDYNIASNRKVEIGELIRLIADELNYKGPIIEKPERVADVKCHIGGMDKLKKLIRYEPTPFSIALRETIDWYKSLQS